MALRIDLPRHEAELLEAFVRGVSWSELWSRRDEGFDVAEYNELVARRLAGEPLAYITGRTNFYGIDIECGPGVLVPRPETEILVDVALALIADVPSPTVIDIGTGTGCIALAISTERPDATVYATESSDEALAWARRNIEGSRVRLVRGDLFAGCRRCDLVVSNPPYVVDGADLPADVHREPAQALFGGPDGNAVIDRIIDGVTGAVALEIGTSEQAAHVVSRLPGARIHEDLTGRPRVVSCP